jgi:homoserine acetyltransferase
MVAAEERLITEGFGIKQHLRLVFGTSMGGRTQGHLTLRKASIYAPFVADFLAKILMAQ